MDFLFGEGQYGLRFLFAFIVVLGLIGLTAWLVRRFGADRLGSGTQRGRQPRLAVIDAAAVDGRRRLILIRRDNVEHLLMIGGPTDVVVEANIVRAAAQRDAAAPRPPATPELPQRGAPLGDGNMWPLQPEPPAVPPPPPMPRQPRQPAPPPHAEEPMQWHAEPEPPPPPPLPPRPPRPEPRAEPRLEPRASDPLAGLAAELSRHQAEPPPPPPPRPMRERPAPPPAPPADQQFASSADQNLAEMAQRLEAALRRPGAKTDGRATEPKQRSTPQPAPQPPAPPPPAPQPEPQMEAPPPPAEPKPAREPKQPRDPQAAPQGKNLYDSLEQEMASLLGRPNKT